MGQWYLGPHCTSIQPFLCGVKIYYRLNDQFELQWGYTKHHTGTKEQSRREYKGYNLSKGPRVAEWQRE